MTSFPYIRQIHVNDCYTYQNLDIPIKPLTELKHIIITGKNGSGKTTILKGINNMFNDLKNGWVNLQTFYHVNIIFSDKNYVLENASYNLFSFFSANRKVEVQNVPSVSQETEFIQKLKSTDNENSFSNQFKQYLVNKKIYEAFDLINNKEGSANQNRIFFDTLTNTFRRIFEDSALELEFVQENFEFYLKMGDGRRITFNQLSEGFSSFISILMDLLMRVDLIRKDKGDFSFDPPGIVLIDEPETHFHLTMQYEILPLLTTLFPHIQFIAATHSPAVISSIKDAVVYDLSSRQEIQGMQAGSSFSELMVRHFGLDNEFSPVADEILAAASKAIKAKDADGLKQVLAANEQYLTPSLKLELESYIIHLESMAA